MKNLTKEGKDIKNYFSDTVFKKRIDDAEYDRLINQSLSGIDQLALDKVCISREDCIKEPVMIIGPPNFKRLSGLEFHIKKGKDNYLRYMPLGITVYNFASHSLLAYQCDFDPTTGNNLNDSTFEYFYNDIVSFETVTESGSHTDYDWKDKILKSIPILKSIVDTGKVIQADLAQKFILTTSGGSRLSVTLSEDILKEITKGGSFQLSKASKSINVVRRIIRGKKSYTLQDT